MWDPVENNEASSTSDYVANSSCTDSTNSDEMEYDSEVLETSSSCLKIQGSKPYCPLTAEMITAIINHLNDNGFYQHFKSVQGGSYEDSCIKTSIRRVARFLSYTYSSLHHHEILQPEYVNDWVLQILTKHYYTLFPNYVNYIGTVLHKAPNTILIELMDLKKFIHWFVYYRSSDKEMPRSLDHIDCIISNLSKYQRKLLKRRRSDAPDMDDLVNNRSLPKGGLKELKDVLESDLEWFHNLKHTSGIIEAMAYKHFMGMLYSSLYVYSPQGRISAIGDLKLMHADDLLTNGYVLSTRFKTNAEFGYQPVTIAEVSMNLLSFYIKSLRPQIAKNSLYLKSDNSPLFLNHNGTAAKRIGDKVQYC